MDDPLVDTLIELLNLSKNEARVYVEILKYQQDDPVELSNSLGLPKSRIYETLKKLSQRHLLEKNLTSFGYRLVPPNEAIKSIIDQFNKEHHSKMSSLNEFSTHLTNIWQQELSSTISPGVSLLHRDESEFIFYETLRKAKKRVWIAASDDVPSFDMRKSGHILASIYSDDIDFRYIIANEKMAKRIEHGVKKFSPFSKIKIKFAINPNVYTSFILIDNLIFVYFFGSSNSLEARTLLTSSENMVQSFEWLYKQLWAKRQQIIVAGIIYFNDKILIVQRDTTLNETQAGLWEFPGGKVEFNEPPEEALKREIKEELNLGINDLELFTVSNGVFRRQDEPIHGVMIVYKCKSNTDKIKLNVGKSYQWIDASMLNQFEFAVLDIPVIEKIKKVA